MGDSLHAASASCILPTPLLQKSTRRVCLQRCRAGRGILGSIFSSSLYLLSDLKVTQPPFVLELQPRKTESLYLFLEDFKCFLIKMYYYFVSPWSFSESKSLYQELLRAVINGRRCHFPNSWTNFKKLGKVYSPNHTLLNGCLGFPIGSG